MDMAATFLGVLGVVISTVVVFAYLIVIWLLDRYEREPFWLVLATFAWGALGGTCVGFLLSTSPTAAAVSLLGPELGRPIATIVIAPIVEEFTKALVFIALLATHHIDNETDGLIYGAATGLGFAALENLLYFATAQSSEALFSMIVIRTLFTALVHCISSALIGMAVGWARHRPKSDWPIAILGGYLLALVSHGTWNGLATAASLNEEAAFIAVGGLLVILAAGVIAGLTQLSLKREHDVIRRFLESEAARGTLPAEHAEIIPYWTRRRRRGWLAEGIDRDAYIRAATLLAFRQHQLEIADAANEARYVDEIGAFRAEVGEHLARAR